MTAARPGRRRRTALALALVVVVVAIPLGVYLWGRSSDSFAVKRVTLSGQHRVPRREAERLLVARYLGKNLFTISEEDVRETLSVFPYIAAVAVDRDYPETLRVRIAEYQPAALLLADGAWYVLSTEGQVVARLESPHDRQAEASPRPTGSPTAVATPSISPKPAPSSGVVTTPSAAPSSGSPADQKRVGPLPMPPARLVPNGLRRLPLMATDAPVVVGERVADEHVVEGLQMVAALSAGLRHDVAAVRVTDTGARLYLRPSLEVEFGAPDDLPVKVLALQAVLRRYLARRVRATFVDVSVPDRPLGAPMLPTPAAP